MRAEKNGAAPEFAEPLTLNADVLHDWRVHRRRDRRDVFHKCQGDAPRGLGVKATLLRFAVKVARRAVPLPSLASVRAKFQYVSGRSMKGLVAIEQCLQRVFARLQVAQAADGIPEDARTRRIHRAHFVWLPVF